MQIIHTNQGNEDIIRIYMSGDKLMIEGDQFDLEMTKTESLALASMLMDLARETKPTPKPKATRKRKAKDENC